MQNRTHERGSFILAILVMVYGGFGCVSDAIEQRTSLGRAIYGAKQVKQVAEAGLYHAITFMNREGASLLRAARVLIESSLLFAFKPMCRTRLRYY